MNLSVRLNAVQENRLRALQEHFTSGAHPIFRASNLSLSEVIRYALADLYTRELDPNGESVGRYGF